jgi:hypothetical protein
LGGRGLSVIFHPLITFSSASGISRFRECENLASVTLCSPGSVLSGVLVM